MPDDLTMASIYILPFAGRVDQKLRSIVEASPSGAQWKAYISRDGLSKQISHATDSSTLGLAAGINNHHTHIVSYASLEMDFWKWHPEGCLSVNAPFKHGKCSRLAFLKNETVAMARCNSSQLLVLWEPKGGVWRPKLTFGAPSFQCWRKSRKAFLCKAKA